MTDLPPTRNIVDVATADRNRSVGLKGAYTFNAPIPDDYDGPAFTVAVVRVGDHAHVDVESGRAGCQNPLHYLDRVVMGRGYAGRLVLAWADWLVLRGVLDAHPCFHVCEVERPTAGQAEFHTGPRR